jgi:PKD repeat protein
MSQETRLLKKRFVLIFAIFVALGTLVVGAGLRAFRGAVALAASPSGGTISPSSPTVNYGGGPFNSINQTDSADTATISCTPATPCDDFALAVAIPPGDTNTYNFTASISWTDKATATSSHNDFDFFVYDSKGKLVSGSSGATSANPEVISVSVNDSSYTIRVLPFDVNVGPTGDTYHATVTLAPVPGAPPFLKPPALAGDARYQNYAAPNGLGTTAGEPSIGVDWPTGKVFMSSDLQTLRVTFDDCPSPAKTTWEDKSATTSQDSLDPILFTDHNGQAKDRTFVSQLTGQDSLTSFTDDDGDNWTPSQGGGVPSGVDHQSIGGGPYRTDASAVPPVVPPPHPTYPNAIYYCSQDIAASFCARSDNGGQTFGAGVPIYNTNQCGGIHGHVKVAPDGTVYVPNKSCGGKQGVARSRDNGVTWTVITDPSSTASSKLVDPAVGIGKNGTVYFSYQSGVDGSNSFPPKVAVIHTAADGTVTWSNDQVLGAEFGIKNSTFPEAISSAFNPSAVSADDNRAAVAFLGTTAAGDYTNTSFKGAWHLFVSTTVDGGVSWRTVDATPNDPVQRGSICNLGTTACVNTPDDRNLLDFMDMTIDRQGRVLVGYPDGCIGGCVNGTENSFTHLATIARQSGGRRLISAFDPVEPALPGAPVLKVFSDGAGIHLSWQEPDAGGSPITNYKVYRRPQGSSQKTLIGNVGTNTTFDDFSANPTVTYFYSVSAVNAIGEGLTCGEVSATALPPVDPCSLPGVSLVTDPTGDAKPPTAALDIQQVWVAEPFDPANPNASKLTWTMKVASLATVPPNGQWYIIWDFGKGVRRYVAMLTDGAGTPSFRYGHVGPALAPTNPDPAANKPFDDGAADSGSFAADGTIRITISNSKVAECIPTDSSFSTCSASNNAPKAGSTIANISPRTFSGSGTTNVTGSSATDSTSNTPAYTLSGNFFCRPEHAPVAQLNVSPTSGPAPLTVNFDGSASSDPDPGDGIGSYTFDFGDTFFTTQTSPMISHTYPANGVYPVKLYVRDTRGMLTASPATANITVSTPPAPATNVQFGSSSYSVGEGDGRVNVTVTRTGDISGLATVFLSTSDNAGLQNCNIFNGIASARCDYATTFRVVQFNMGETAKTFSIPIVDDSYAEGNETFSVNLTNPLGASLGTPSTATVTIIDNDSTTGPNPINLTDFFVRQHYIDFLLREPDPPGFAGWVSTINNCASGDQSCDRVHVSQAFYTSPEFQARGYFVYRFYSVAFGRKPNYAEFVPDLSRVSGFLTDSQLEAAKVAFMADFMARSAFINDYNGLTNADYVNLLLQRAAVALSNKQAMIDGLNNATLTRAQVLRQIVESNEVSSKYFNQAFVVMQ